MIAVPSWSKIGERAVRQRDAVRRDLERRFAALVGDEIGQITHVERVIGVGIHVAGRSRIEVAACARERRAFALADRVDVDAVRTRLEAADGDRDFDGLRARHVFHVVTARHLRVDFAHFDRARDAVALEFGFGLERGLCGGEHRQSHRHQAGSETRYRRSSHIHRRISLRKPGKDCSALDE